jgi:hypothetical protein
MEKVPITATVSNSSDPVLVKAGYGGSTPKGGFPLPRVWKGSDRSSPMTNIADRINLVRMWIEYPAANGYFSPECSGNVEPTVF